MKTVAIIPARLESNRLKEKVLVDICGKPMIQWVYEAVKKTNLIDEVYVATDSPKIAGKVKDFGGDCIETSTDPQTGSDRVAEAARILRLEGSDWVINVQADEPLIEDSVLDNFIVEIRTWKERKKECHEPFMFTLGSRVGRHVRDTNTVALVMDRKDRALYFSRHIIPHGSETYCKHIGVYGARVLNWVMYHKTLTSKVLEGIEKLEQLRVLENGQSIGVILCDEQVQSVNNEEDLMAVKRIIEMGRLQHVG